MLRWSCPEVFCKKVFLKIPRNSQENTCIRVSFLIKLFSCQYFKMFENNYFVEDLRTVASVFFLKIYLLPFVLAQSYLLTIHNYFLQSIKHEQTAINLNNGIGDIYNWAFQWKWSWIQNIRNSYRNLFKA